MCTRKERWRCRSKNGCCGVSMPVFSSLSWSFSEKHFICRRSREGRCERRRKKTRFEVCLWVQSAESCTTSLWNSWCLIVQVLILCATSGICPKIVQPKSVFCGRVRKSWAFHSGG